MVQQKAEEGFQIPGRDVCHAATLSDSAPLAFGLFIITIVGHF